MKTAFLVSVFVALSQWFALPSPSAFCSKNLSFVQKFTRKNYFVNQHLSQFAQTRGLRGDDAGNMATSDMQEETQTLPVRHCNESNYLIPSTEQVFNNPQGVGGLHKTITVSGKMDEHSISKYLVISVNENEVKSGIEIAECDFTQKLTWFQKETPETVLGAVLNAFTPAGRSLGHYLKSACDLLSNYMTNLKEEIEKEYRTVIKRAGNRSTCRGCKMQHDCLTLAQKKIQRQHVLACDQRREKQKANMFVTHQGGDIGGRGKGYMAWRRDFQVSSISKLTYIFLFSSNLRILESISKSFRTL